MLLTYSNANANSENSFRARSVGSSYWFGLTPNEPLGFDRVIGEVWNVLCDPDEALKAVAVIGATDRGCNCNHRRAANRHWPTTPKRCILKDSAKGKGSSVRVLVNK